MKVHHKEFAAMHREMASWCERQEREGWQNKDVEHWATFVRCCLWSLSQTKDIHPVQLQALGEYTDNFERARGTGAVGPLETTGPYPESMRPDF